jgi:hypothetical protein
MKPSSLRGFGPVGSNGPSMTTTPELPALPEAVAYAGDGVLELLPAVGEGSVWLSHAQQDGQPNALYTAAQLHAYALSALAAARGQEGEDAARLDWIASEYLTVEPFDMPTGQGDADVGWRVFQYHGRERKLIAEHHVDNVRAAIDAARQQEEDALVPLDTTAGVDRG